MTEPKKNWWKGAALYQIYPRSFQDSNHDGVGDLRGLLQRLDYIQSLGVQGLWIGPFFKSPMVDFGYDVSDYREVSEIFGTLEDFVELLKECHRRELKVIIDLVLSHTSDQHSWFQQSVQNPSGPFGDYYIWRDAKEGREPNNWLAVFGGSAWEWCEERGQYYLHNFLKQQPDLNFHNPKVQEELCEVLRFWAKLGVDGFRLDACNCYFHNSSFHDNPVSPFNHVDVQDETNPYFKQIHLFDKSQPENLEFMKKLRSVVDEFEDRFLLGEIFCDREEETTRLYSADGYPLHSTYNFSLLHNHRQIGTFRDSVVRFHSISKDTAWSLSNHDVTRVVSRWKAPIESSLSAKGYLTLLLSLPGMPILYQGEELGLTEALIDRSEIQDPFGQQMKSDYRGRDGCRTPLPWQSDKEFCGFSHTKPWLEIPIEHRDLSVSEQDDNPQSALRHTRRILQFRKESEVLRRGGVHFWQDDPELVVYSRYIDHKGLLVIASFFDQPLAITGMSGVRVLEEVSWGLKLKSKDCLLITAGGHGLVEIEV